DPDRRPRPGNCPAQFQWPLLSHWRCRTLAQSGRKLQRHRHAVGKADMCIAYLAISAHPRWPLFIAANRDEFHARPCRAAAPWPDRPDIISGIDTLAGGTWLGVTKQGRYALITNYRDLSTLIPDAPSRGAL